MPSVASRRLGGWSRAVVAVDPLGRLFQREDAADNGGDLLLGGRSASRDALLDAHRGVFRNGQAAAQRRCHGHALRPSQFEHRLHVLAEERRFERHFARGVLVDQRPDPFEDIAQFDVRIRKLVQVDVAQDDRAHAASVDLQYAVTHVVGAGVDAHDAVFFRWGHIVRKSPSGRRVAVRRGRLYGGGYLPSSSSTFL